MARASEETTLRRFSEGLTIHNISHQILKLKTPQKRWHPFTWTVTVDEVTLGLSIYDGSVNIHDVGKVFSVPVPSRRKRFNPYELVQCLKQKKHQLTLDKARQERIRPYRELIHPFERASSARLNVRMDSDLNKEGRVHLVVSGYFTLDELRKMMDGIEATGILNEEIVRQVMES
jgi:hypothetical protein